MGSLLLVIALMLLCSPLALAIPGVSDWVLRLTRHVIYIATAASALGFVWLLGLRPGRAIADFDTLDVVFAVAAIAGGHVCLLHTLARASGPRASRRR